MPDALELPGMLCAVVPLVGGERFPTSGRDVVDELVALALRHFAGRFRHAATGRLPGRAAVVGALDDLAEPPTRLRRVQPVGIGRGSLDVINLPAREVRAADRTPTELAVGRANECTFECADEDTHAAHEAIISAGSLR